ncbi:MAG: hypothetical protein V3U28_00495 [Candidatus Acidoferrales bacterium]
MVYCQERTLGPEALTHLKQCLDHGGTLLAKHLLQRADLDNGKVTTFLPSDVPDEKALLFESGQLPVPPKSEWVRLEKEAVMIPVPKTIDDYFVPFLLHFLRAERNRICIFGHPDGKATHPWLARAKADYFTCGEEVFLFVFGKNATEKKIKTVIKEAGSAWWSSVHGVVTTVPTRFRFSVEQRTSATPEIVAELATRAEKIMVGAYDMEGYLIWHKP